MIDPAQLESAVLNLALNARDAMSGGGTLVIETANVQLDAAYADANQDARPGDYVMIAVSDSGTGMSPEIMRHAFEPFFTTKETGKGTGLGLSMVFGFIKQSGGHVKLYSELSHGTTVKMYLPRAADAADEGQTARESAGEEPHGGGTILLVEDEALVRKSVSDQLRSLGYTVIEVENGPAALKILQSADAIDLLFTDIVMPGGMSGRELAEQAHMLRPGLKILYTSGYTQNSMVHHSRLDPGVYLLNKPYRLRELAQKVRAVLAET